MTPKQAVALGRFCGLAEFIRDCKELQYLPYETVQKRLIEILEEYHSEESCKQSQPHS